MTPTQPKSKNPNRDGSTRSAKEKKSFTPGWKPSIIWGQWLGEEACPYMRRWVLNFGKFSVRYHVWKFSDDGRYLHDHSWWFWTVVLQGGYTDISDRECELCEGDGIGRGRGGYKRDYECQECSGRGRVVVHERMRRFRPTFRPAHHRHTVSVDPGGARTVMITGPFSRKWGFWIGEKRDEFVGVRKYFRTYGHPPCADE